MSAEFEPFSLRALYVEARETDVLFHTARRLYAERAGLLFLRGDDAKVAITASDAGRCSAQVQAEIAGRYDIPDADFGLRDAGTLHGAWIACLIAANIHMQHREFYLEMETDPAWGGVGGHTDIAIRRAGTDACVQVGEIKTTSSFTVRPPHEPGKTVPANLHHVIQACQRALAEGAPIATVYTHGPSAWDEQHYEVETWRAAVEAEYARLAVGALDPQRSYQCESCRVSACPQNKNANRPAVFPGVAV